ncbi:MAG TPA: hypothetical protein GXZ46_06550 [Actinomycetales bacterium]|nr:hypothetical protein [Actinomycetales bacterium]
MSGDFPGAGELLTWPVPFIALLAAGAAVWGGRLAMTTVRLWFAPIPQPRELVASAVSSVLLMYFAWQLFGGAGLLTKGVYVFPGPDLRWGFMLPATLAAASATLALSRRRRGRRGHSGRNHQYREGNRNRREWAAPMIAAALYTAMLPVWDGSPPWPMAVAVAVGVAASWLRVLAPGNRGLPWRDSLKDAADAIGDGLAYFDSRDREVLVNPRMARILAELGVPPASVRDSWAAMVRAGDGPPDVPTEASAVTFHCADRVYVAERNRVHGRRGRWYTELRVIDVTELATANRELMLDNERLLAAMAETRELLASIERIEKEQVLLDFRTRLHDVVAQRVSVVQRFLESGVGTPDRMATLGRMLMDVRADIGSDHAAPRTLLRRVRESFATAGVAVDVVGELPSDLAHAATAVRIIRQAATNAVAHGAATSVSAVFEETPGFWRLTVSNDGDLPERVTEGTGLSGVRATVEALGGSLGYTVNDVFSLVAEVPRADGPEPPAAGEPAGPAGTGGAGGDGCAG